MPAMTMTFRASEDVSGLRAGMRVRFRSDGRTASRIERVPADEGDMPKAERVLRPGDPAPSFTLTDQNGFPVSMADLKGRVVALNFLYTRCPVPEVCPRLAASFAFLHRRFGDRLALVSITVDPQWDTPEVLSAYAKLWRARADSWRFLTGSPETVARVGRDYGLVYWPDEGAVAHTARTYVIGRDGVVAAVLEGTSWRPEQLAGVVAHQLENGR